MIRRVRHEATDTSYLDQGGEPSRYDNTFEAIPYDVPFRPLRVTEKPFVHGPQTAMVVGPPGEKIFTDKHGRVRVQFHWDRYGKHDDKSSCWIRVSQAWAGQRLGRREPAACRARGRGIIPGRRSRSAAGHRPGLQRRERHGDGDAGEQDPERHARPQRQ